MGDFSNAVFAITGAGSGFGRLARPDEVADAMLWLCCDANSYMNGAAVSVVAGWWPADVAPSRVAGVRASRSASGALEPLAPSP